MTADDLLAIEYKLAEMNEHLFNIHYETVQSNQLILHLCAFSLFTIGVAGALLVLFLLYKFLRQFF